MPMTLMSYFLPHSTLKCEETQRRVLFFDHTAVWSGGEIALYHLIDALDPTRYIPVVVLCEEGPLAVKLRDRGIEVYLLPLNPSVTHTRREAIGAGYLLRVKDIARVIAYVVRFARFARQQRVEIIHTNSLKSDILGGLGGRLIGIPVIWHIRDRITAEYLSRPLATLFRFLSRYLPRHVVANSHSTYQTLLGEEKVPGFASALPPEELSSQSHYTVVHDGIPLNSFEATPTSRSKPPCIGIVGRLSPWKGQHIFLEAAHRIHQRFPDAQFQIIGAALFDESDYEAQLHEMCHENQLKEYVKFMGFRNDVGECIRKLDILVHASTIGEPFGQVVIEGMIAGKPVVATQGGGIPEIITHDCSGILIPMNDSQALSEAVCRLLEAPDEAHIMGLRGRERVLEHFLIEKTVHKIEALFDQFARPGKRRRRLSRTTRQPEHLL